MSIVFQAIIWPVVAYKLEISAVEKQSISDQICFFAPNWWTNFNDAIKKKNLFQRRLKASDSTGKFLD